MIDLCLHVNICDFCFVIYSMVFNLISSTKPREWRVFRVVPILKKQISIYYVQYSITFLFALNQ